MSDVDFEALNAHGKQYAGLTPEDEALLMADGPALHPQLKAVTDGFYEVLLAIPEARPFLEGRVERLRQTHHAWLERLFTGPFDADFARHMYDVGVVHVRVKLPVEFMACGIAQIGNHLIPVLTEQYRNDPARLAAMLKASNAVLGYSLILMQESYQTSLLAAELERFMAITGISRTLFNNLAKAYKD